MVCRRRKKSENYLSKNKCLVFQLLGAICPSKEDILMENVDTTKHKEELISEVKNEISAHLGIDAADIEYLLNYLYERAHLRGSVDSARSSINKMEVDTDA